MPISLPSLDVSTAEVAGTAEASWGRLVSLLARENGLAVAFSGGLDSAVLLDAAIEALGADRVVAFTAVSPSLAAFELETARSVARELGAKTLEVPTDELADPGYVANAGDRCYYCKRELFAEVKKAGESLGLSAIAYGYHKDDDADVRPGLKAALEAGVLRPLYEAGLGKKDLREIARARGRSFAEKPSGACLSSRLPVGMTVTEERLGKVEAIEAFLRQRGFVTFRARLDRDDLVRVEVAPSEIARLASEMAIDEQRALLLETARREGISRVALDLVGYHRAGETG
ncbi:MAG TPA: ATP-dependent sacrificial sulfur transferase LarE [Thermoanaerobaculia bacterium]|nr:ATP-dependent sacrificial sulfur transferase LarE [Thermoanaerobaculia bacterium]